MYDGKVVVTDQRHYTGAIWPDYDFCSVQARRRAKKADYHFCPAEKWARRRAAKRQRFARDVEKVKTVAQGILLFGIGVAAAYVGIFLLGCIMAVLG